MIYLWAFLVGGALCAVAQVLIDRTALTPARILVVYVVAGVVLGACGLWEPVVEFAGSGATVPLVGFGYTVARGVREAVNGGEGLLGALTGGLSAASGGISAALIAGLLAALIFKSKRK